MFMKIRYINFAFTVGFHTELVSLSFKGEHGKEVTEEEENHITNSHQQAYHSDGNPRTDNTRDMSASQMGSAAAMQVSFVSKIFNCVKTHVRNFHLGPQKVHWWRRWRRRWRWPDTTDFHGHVGGKQTI
jgi:hypothetical protein